MTTFSADTVLAASGPLVQVRLGSDGLPAGAIAAARAARDGSSTVRHSASTARYMMNSTSTEVSRPSHTQ